METNPTFQAGQSYVAHNPDDPATTLVVPVYKRTPKFIWLGFYPEDETLGFIGGRFGIHEGPEGETSDLGIRGLVVSAATTAA